jgi:DNA-binding GntR family transcriptional regulator
VDEESIKEEGDFLAMRYLLIDKFNLDIEYVTEAITAVAADQSLADNLEIVKQHPLIRIDRISYDKDYIPLEYVRYFVRSDYWEYNVVYDKKVLHNN